MKEPSCDVGAAYAFLRPPLTQLHMYHGVYEGDTPT
jgi:hypothetical protein